MKNLLPLPVLAIATLLWVPLPGFAQVLLTTSDFTLLAGTAVSVGGPGPDTFLNGHVHGAAGTSGFPPATVAGNVLSGAAATVIAAPNGITIQALADLNTARNALAAMVSPPANNLTGQDLGTLAAPLAPGVYAFNTSALQNGALVLDAQGQNGVAWVFQFGTFYTTAVNSTVTIINYGSNGGSDLGVYFNAGTAINIGDSNTVLGNYLAGTSISFTGITTTLGNGGVRALALAGVSFAGPGAANALGGPGGGDMDGGLMYDPFGVLVPIPPPVIPPVIPPVVPPVVPIPPVVVIPIIVYSGNVILSATGSFAPGSSGVTLVPGTDYPATILTIDGNSTNGSAPASLTINTATVTLTGTGNTYTGGTVVNSGVLIASSATLPANGPIALNISTLNFDQASTGTFGGVISGSGAVIKLGAGALTVTGANTYSGGTIINAGSLIASTTSLPANRAVAITPAGTLVFDQAANGTFGGAITGGGTIQKRGAGALTLGVTTTSPVEVQAGTFLLTSGIGRTTVSAGATLGGNGTITGNLVNNGTVSPGTSPGTINVTGNFTQSASGTLLIEIASASSFDKVIATGSASLAGTVLVNTLDGYNPLGQSFTFLTAAGGVTGTFGSLTGNVSSSAATAATVVYAPTTATVTFTQRPFAGFAVTPNQAAVGAAAQDVPVLTAALNTLPSAGQFPAALNAHSPQPYQIWSDFAFAHSTSLADRLLRDERAVVGHDEYYFEGGQRRGRSRADLDVGSSRYASTAGLVGGNHAVNPSTTVGAYFAFGKTTSGLGSPDSHTTVKEKTLGVRAAWADGPLFAEAMLAYGFNRYESTRPVVFPGTSALATSSTRGHQWTTGLTVGQHLKLGPATVSPFAGLLASQWTGNRFTEEGAGVYDVTVAKQTARSLRSQLGVEGRLTFGMIQPHVRAAWLHEFSDKSRAMHASFDGVSFSVDTRRAQRDSALYSAGLDLVLGPNALIYTNVTAGTGGATKVLSEWLVGLSVSF